MAEDARARGMRAIRGAITVAEDTPAHIAEATRELLAAIVDRNGLEAGDLVSAIFTLTPDLRSEFPALAAREMGWTDVALLCTVEVDVPGALPRCLRVLVHVETARGRSEIRHVYLRDAAALRPDLG